MDISAVDASVLRHDAAGPPRAPGRKGRFGAKGIGTVASIALTVNNISGAGMLEFPQVQRAPPLLPPRRRVCATHPPTPTEPYPRRGCHPLVTSGPPSATDAQPHVRAPTRLRADVPARRRRHAPEGLIPPVRGDAW